MLIRRQRRRLQALQHVVATTFRKQLGDDNRIVIDCNGYRRDKDANCVRWHCSWRAKLGRRGCRRKWGR